MAEASLVTCAVQNGIADIRLNRPEKRNALTPSMFDAILRILHQLETAPTLRCAILSGEGEAFCAGIDLPSLAANPAPEGLTPRTHGIANRYQHAAWGWRALPVPVIAALHGAAFGAGFQLALGADIRIAAPQTLLSAMELRWGLVPDMAGFALLRALTRDDIARELIYTARKFSAEEAASLGLVTRLAADAREAALALAAEIAAQSPQAIRAAKRILTLPNDPAILLQAESTEQEALLASASHAETLQAARENRAPAFKD